MENLREQRDFLQRRVDELFEQKIRLLSALSLAKRILDDAEARDENA
jgi:hypothetical protein